MSRITETQSAAKKKPSLPLPPDIWRVDAYVVIALARADASDVDVFVNDVEVLVNEIGGDCVS
jgi:hypothetical protein